MRELPQHIIAKVSGPAWEQLRRQFIEIGRLLLTVSPDAHSELLTTYVKFTINTVPQRHVVQAQPSFGEQRVFGAVWYKNSKRLIVGLSLPEQYEAEELGPPLPGTTYKGLNKYFVVERGGAVPKGLAEWAGPAYQNALSAEPLTGTMNRLAATGEMPGLLRRAG